jgi:hypothetical protein
MENTKNAVPLRYKNHLALRGEMLYVVSAAKWHVVNVWTTNVLQSSPAHGISETDLPSTHSSKILLYPFGITRTWGVEIKNVSTHGGGSQ